MTRSFILIFSFLLSLGSNVMVLVMYKKIDYVITKYKPDKCVLYILFSHINVFARLVINNDNL